jgi:hypothetical protein
MKNYLRQILNGQRPLIDIWHYFVGNYRYKLYYSKYKWLIRKHIREQIEYRINVMKTDCLLKGECTECGCATPALQMCSKACEGSCYPAMMEKDFWLMLPKCIRNYKRLKHVERHRKEFGKS